MALHSFQPGLYGKIVSDARSNLDYLQSRFERQLQLYNLGAISKAVYLIALNGYNSAKAAVNNAFAQLHVTTSTLSYTNIYSPLKGMLLNRNKVPDKSLPASSIR